MQSLHLGRFATVFTDRNSCGKFQLKEFEGFIRRMLARYRDGTSADADATQTVAAAWPKSTEGAGSLVVVCGDLNMKPVHPEFAEFTDMMAALPITPPLQDAWEGRWEPTFALRHRSQKMAGQRNGC